MADMFLAVVLSLIAGLATVLGGFFVVLIKKIKTGTIGFLMGFSAGVMLIISFIDLLSKAFSLVSNFWVVLGFILGALVIMICDMILPHIELTFAKKEKGILKSKLFNLGILMAIGLGIHNLPEGLVVGVSYMYLPSFGLLMALAIAIHNFPEGIAIAVPLMGCKMNKLKIIKYTLLSSLAEPLGALLGAVFLIGISNSIVGIMLAFASGVMVYITADELIPIAYKYNKKHSMSLGLLSGFIFMMIIRSFF